MRLPIARLLVKAAKWLAPRIEGEIDDEVRRRTGIDLPRVSRAPGVPYTPPETPREGYGGGGPPLGP